MSALRGSRHALRPGDGDHIEIVPTTTGSSRPLSTLRVGYDDAGVLWATLYPDRVLHDAPPAPREGPRPVPATTSPEPVARGERIPVGSARPFRTFNPLSQCVGKVGYATKAEAKAVRTRVEQKPGPGRLRAYRCRHCGLFHLGNEVDERARQATRDDVGRGSVAS